MKTLLIFFAIIFTASAAVAVETEIPIGRFSTGDLTGWGVQSIGMMKTKTNYTITGNGNRRFLTAKGTRSASGLIYKISLDPREHQSIKWSWKIEHTNKKSDEKIKEGDDFPVRIYVVFNRGVFSSNRAICYVWSNKLTRGKHLASPYSGNIITVAADSGNELAGQWVSHRTNVYEDYKRFFKEEPPKIGAIAIMTDSDNTGEASVGYYGDISMIRTAKAAEAKPKETKNKEPLHKEIKPKEQKPKEQAAPPAAAHPAPGKPDLKQPSHDPKGIKIPETAKPAPGVKQVPADAGKTTTSSTDVKPAPPQRQ